MAWEHFERWLVSSPDTAREGVEPQAQMPDIRKNLRLIYLKKWLFWLRRRKHRWAPKSPQPSHDSLCLSLSTELQLYFYVSSPTLPFTISSFYKDPCWCVQSSHTQACHIVKPHKWKTNFSAPGRQTWS